MLKRIEVAIIVGFAERNYLKIMNTFCDRKTSKKQTRKIRDGEAENGINIILIAKQKTTKNSQQLPKFL